MSHHHDTPAGVRGDRRVDGLLHSLDYGDGAFLDFNLAGRVAGTGLGQPGLDREPVGEGLRGLPRALVWAGVNGTNLERLQASRQALSLIDSHPAQRRIRNVLEPVIGVRVSNQPDLGDALNTNQIGAAERTHRAGDVFSTCQARVDRSGCGEPRRDHRRSGPYARTHRPAPAENPRKRRPRRAPGSPSRERCRACSAPPL